VLEVFLPASGVVATTSASVAPVDRTKIFILDDQELIDRAMSARNGADFTRLWNGDSQGYPSRSEADLALCNMLSFWTGRDAGRIDSLFRASGLMREKWERDDYRTRTIDAAISATTDVYTPAATGAPSPLGASASTATASTSKSRTLTDDGNAYRLVDLHGHDLRYVPGAGWYAWDGSRWLQDSSGEPMRRARLLAERLREEAKLRVSEHGKDDDFGKAMNQHAKASASARGLQAMLTIARSDRRVIVDVAELDADPLLLNTPNGTIDLRTGQLRAHERGDLIARRVAVPYDPDAAAPTWSTFLDRVLPTAEVRECAQRMVGAAAIGHNRDELVHVSYGPGANGKTKFSETIRTCLGDYAATADPELFLAQRGRSAAQPELARLRGVRLVTAAETEEGRRLNVALVKALTGGDTIATRYLYANEIVEFVPVFSPWLRTNHRPAISDQSEAIWRRVRLLPFTVTIPRSERDTNLQGKLLAELPGVLRWIVDGARAYLKDGLDPPDEVVAATAHGRIAPRSGRCSPASPGTSPRTPWAAPANTPGSSTGIRTISATATPRYRSAGASRSRRSRPSSDTRRSH
jgi:putative DNA primase/helicase